MNVVDTIIRETQDMSRSDIQNQVLTVVNRRSF